MGNENHAEGQPALTGSQNAAYLDLVCIIFFAVDDREIATLLDYRSEDALMRLDR